MASDKCLLLFLALILLQVVFVHSKTIYVDGSTSNSAEDCTGESEQEACPTIQSGLFLAENNDTVLVQPGEYTGDGNEGLVFGNTTTVKGVTLRGDLGGESNSAVRIVCSKQGRFLFGKDDFFSQVSDFSVENCVANEEDGSDRIDFGGGAMKFAHHHSGLLIENMAFTNNTARYGGALLVADASVTFVSCTFTKNIALYWGGAIKTIQSGVTIESCYFHNNFCDGSLIANPSYYLDAEGIGGGGAVHSNKGSFVDVRSTRFHQNSARVMGGAFCVETMGSTTFFDVDFDGNHVHGGSDCLDESNCRIRGGALLISNTVASITFSNFSNNHVVTSDISKFAEAGALYVSEDASISKSKELTITGVKFSNNSAYGSGDNNSGGRGGAIYTSGIDLYLIQSIFEGNYARSDGLFTEYPSAGGALYLTQQANSKISNCEFVGNFVEGGRAGAIFATDSHIIDLVNSTLWRNFVTSSYNFKSSGGALSIAQHAAAHVENCTFQRNFANPKLTVTPRTYSGIGGAIFAETADATVFNSFFFDNHVSSGQFDSGGTGGAIGVENCKGIVISDSVFVLNSARGFVDSNTYSNSGSGGALSFMFSSAVVQDSFFTKNWVSAGGAEFSIGGAVAIFYSASSDDIPESIEFNDCEFEANAANGEVCSKGNLVRAGQGGAVAVIGVTAPGVLFTNSTFSRNIANTESDGIVSSFGGAIYYSLGSKVVLQHCSLLKNVGWNGFGDDICSGFNGDASNELQLLEPILESVTYAEATHIHRSLLKLIDYICSSLSSAEHDEIAVYPDSVKNMGDKWNSIVSNFEDPWRDTRFVDDDSEYEYSPVEVESYFHDLSIDQLPADLREYPSILVSSGRAEFLKPSFLNRSYQIWGGDVLGLLIGEAQSQEATGLVSPDLIIVGDVRTSALELVGISANFTVVDQLSRASIMLRSIAIVNSTLYHSNDINVSSSSAIIGCTISSFIPSWISNITQFNNYMPIITYQSVVATGFGTVNIPGPIGNIQARIFSSDLILMRSSIRINGRLIFSSLSNGIPLNKNKSSVFVRLYNRSTIFVESEGEVVVDTTTNIFAEQLNETAIINLGVIDIGGSNPSYEKSLRVFGNVVQRWNATTSIRISNANYSVPALIMASNESFLGTINVSLSEDTVFIPQSDSPDPYSWSIIEFFDSVSLGSTENEVRTCYPPGLYFEESVELSSVDSDGTVEATRQGREENLQPQVFIQNQKAIITRSPASENDLPYNDSEAWVYSITSTSLSCEARNENYDFQGKQSSAQYRCHICLLNSSCGYCGEGLNGCESSSSACNNGAYFHDDNCCPDGCNGKGSCTSNSEKTSFSCDCDFFWDGSSCDVLSIYAYLLIAVGVFSIVIGLITLRYYFKYRHQKRKVLDDLRENLLGDNNSVGNQTYLQAIQQDLILRDVFVPYDEIKIEKKIGEGSFGEVFMASFRGAQVAVKQMRTPVFLQFTEKDIEEFRKEAYMMSRLRHPNIVLVMGVSILEQEAPQPPPGYDDDEDDARHLSTDSQADRKRLASHDAKGGKKTQPKIRSVCIITEYLEQGSLADILYGANKVSDEIWTYDLVLTCALQAARGMLYLHSYQPPICHRDLKSSNLVVDDHWVVKVTDFGMSRIVPTKIQNIETGVDKEGSSANVTSSETELDSKLIDEETGSIASSRRVNFDESANETWERESFMDVDTLGGRHSNTEMTSNLGTTAWCAPELLTQSNKTKYSVKVDVYSFGMVLWELWERKKPYEEMTSRFDIIDAVREGRRPPISNNCPPTFRSLIQRCWHELPARRPTFAYIVRYLKDELAHIKRQRTMSSSMSPYAVSHLLNPQSNSGVDPSSAARAVQRAYNNSINTNSNSTEQAPLSPGEYPDLTSSYVPPPLPTSEEAEERDSTMSSTRSSFLSFMFGGSSQPPESSTASTSSGALPFWRKPKQSKSTKNSSSPSETVNAMHHDPPPTTPAPSTPSSRQGEQWRDKYVLKFNGWNSSKPDSNLPPPSTSRSSSSYKPPVVASTSATARSQVEGPEFNNSIDAKSASEESDDRISFADSKEVYAHGRLLQPKTTYEMDTMSSTRSVDPYYGAKSAKDQDLPRKRTNSL